MFRTIKAPRYPEIRLALFPGKTIRRKIREIKPDAIHIPTEGPIGLAGRRFCVKRGIPHTTSYHTKYPQYLRDYFYIPESATYRFMRWFHGKAKAILVPTRSMAGELEANGFRNLIVWSRGVDTALFKPYGKGLYADLERPVFVYAGRVAIEKNIEAFLKADLPGSKVVVGDGPARESLMKQYPQVHWAGYQFGEDLARHYAAGDVFAFPSKTDTFGVVMLEANACGLPVAAYPVTGPIDVVKQGVTGFTDEDLAVACRKALDLNPDDCIAYAQENSWQRCAQTVLDNLAPISW
jgi:glycosyltransferase involved in cell wall biosynthesis